MLNAKEAKELSLGNNRVEKILEDIEAAIIGIAEEGEFYLEYPLDGPDFRYGEKLKETLLEEGYHTDLINFCGGNTDQYILKINWRLS